MSNVSTPIVTQNINKDTKPDKPKEGGSKMSFVLMMVLCIFSTKVWDLAWDVGKSILILIIIIYVTGFINPSISNKIKSIIGDFINIGSDTNFIKSTLSTIASGGMDIINSALPAAKLSSIMSSTTGVPTPNTTTTGVVTTPVTQQSSLISTPNTITPNTPATGVVTTPITPPVTVIPTSTSPSQQQQPESPKKSGITSQSGISKSSDGKSLISKKNNNRKS